MKAVLFGLAVFSGISSIHGSTLLGPKITESDMTSLQNSEPLISFAKTGGKYEEVFDGIPVYNAFVDVDSMGYEYVGEIYSGLTSDLTDGSVLTFDEILYAYKSGLNVYSCDSMAYSLRLYPDSPFIFGKTMTAQMVYEVTNDAKCYSDTGIYTSTVFDAKTGEVLMSSAVGKKIPPKIMTAAPKMMYAAYTPYVPDSTLPPAYMPYGVGGKGGKGKGLPVPYTSTLPPMVPYNSGKGTGKKGIPVTSTMPTMVPYNSGKGKGMKGLPLTSTMPTMVPYNSGNGKGMGMGMGMGKTGLNENKELNDLRNALKKQGNKGNKGGNGNGKK